MKIQFGANSRIHFDQAIRKADQERLQAVFDAAIQYRPDRRFVMANTSDKIDINVRPFPSSGPKRQTEFLDPHDMLDVRVTVRDRVHRNVLDPHVNRPPNGNGSDSHMFQAQSSVDLVREGGGGGDHLSIDRLTNTAGGAAFAPFVDRVVDHMMGSITMLDAALKAAHQAIQTPKL